MNNGKQPITPTMFVKYGDGADDYVPLMYGNKPEGVLKKFTGLTKREYFAGKALQGLISLYAIDADTPNRGNISYIAKLAVTAADALLSKLNEDSQPEITDNWIDNRF